MKIKIFIGHDSKNINLKDIVFSNAIKKIISSLSSLAKIA